MSFTRRFFFAVFSLFSAYSALTAVFKLIEGLTMKAWRISGRCFASPPPADWRAQLAARLGQRPRRIGEWVELALFGARQCLDAAGENELPAAALLSLSSLHGPDIALRAALEQARSGAPLPIGFLNSQPSQALPALAGHLRWSGNGRVLTTREPGAALLLASLEAGPEGMLLGWVDEDAPGQSIWLRLLPAAAGERVWGTATFAMLEDARFNVLAFDGTQLQLGR
jgi:hypothetical protein